MARIRNRSQIANKSSIANSSAIKNRNQILQSREDITALDDALNPPEQEEPLQNIVDDIWRRLQNANTNLRLIMDPDENGNAYFIYQGTAQILQVHQVEGQPDAYELPVNGESLYRLDAPYGANDPEGPWIRDRYCKRDAMEMILNTCAYWNVLDGSPTIGISGMSRKQFNTTRLSRETGKPTKSPHNSGTSVDIKLQHLMLIRNGIGKDGPPNPDYDRMKCLTLSLCSIYAGAGRVYFMDREMEIAVNTFLGKEVMQSHVPPHKNHLHIGRHGHI